MEIPYPRPNSSSGTQKRRRTQKRRPPRPPVKQQRPIVFPGKLCYPQLEKKKKQLRSVPVPKCDPNKGVVFESRGKVDMECSVLTTERVEKETAGEPVIKSVKSGSFKPIPAQPVDQFGKPIPDVSFDLVVSDHQITEKDSGRFMKPIPMILPPIRGGPPAHPPSGPSPGSSGRNPPSDPPRGSSPGSHGALAGTPAHPPSGTSPETPVTKTSSNTTTDDESSFILPSLSYPTGTSTSSPETPVTKTSSNTTLGDEDNSQHTFIVSSRSYPTGS